MNHAPNFFVTPYVQPAAAKFDPKAFRFIGRMSDFGRVLAEASAFNAQIKFGEDVVTRIQLCSAGPAAVAALTQISFSGIRSCS